MFMRVAIIFVGATEKQNHYWWPSYSATTAGYPHDMIFVHRGHEGVPNVTKIQGADNIFMRNKILKTGEIPHKAFGAYRHYFQKYADMYDAFAFISDDVYLRRHDWIKEVVELFEKFPKLGFISPMIHNNPAHMRAPIWFGKTECLKKVDWNFYDDHDGEMTMADRCTAAGYFGIQIGHKFDFAYDPDWDGYANPRVCGSPQPNQWIEKIKFGEEHFDNIYTKEEINSLQIYQDRLFSGDTSEEISDIRISDRLEYQRWNMCFEIQPYHGLIYNKSLPIVKQEGHAFKLYDREVRAGHFNPDECVLFGPSQGRYICQGVNQQNPIAILEI